jgi:hypothetical protein
VATTIGSDGSTVSTGPVGYVGGPKNGLFRLSAPVLGAVLNATCSIDLASILLHRGTGRSVLRPVRLHSPYCWRSPWTRYGNLRLGPTLFPATFSNHPALPQIQAWAPRLHPDGRGHHAERAGAVVVGESRGGAMYMPPERNRGRREGRRHGYHHGAVTRAAGLHAHRRSNPEVGESGAGAAVAQARAACSARPWCVEGSPSSTSLDPSAPASVAAPPPPRHQPRSCGVAPASPSSAAARPSAVLYRPQGITGGARSSVGEEVGGGARRGQGPAGWELSGGEGRCDIRRRVVKMRELRHRRPAHREAGAAVDRGKGGGRERNWGDGVRCGGERGNGVGDR